MKIKLWCDSGANIHSCREKVMDLEKDLGITEEEWKEMDEEQKFEVAFAWANDRLDIGYAEVD